MNTNPFFQKQIVLKNISLKNCVKNTKNIVLKIQKILG